MTFKVCHMSCIAVYESDDWWYNMTLPEQRFVEIYQSYNSRHHLRRISYMPTNLYMFRRWKSSYHEGRVGIPIICLTPSHFVACPKPGTGYPTLYVVLLCSVSSVKMRRDCSFIFVDIGGIDDQHYLKVLFMNILIR